MRLSGGAGLLGLDLGRVEYDTVVSVLCSGEEAAPVAERLRMLSSALAHRRVGQRPGVLRAALAEEVSEPAAAAARALLGNVVVGVGVAQGSAAPKGGGGSGGGAGAGALDVVIARLAAEHAEDVRARARLAAPPRLSPAPPARARWQVFRLLHFAMAPLAPRLGASPYGLRIHADLAALCPIKVRPPRPSRRPCCASPHPRPRGPRPGLLRPPLPPHRHHQRRRLRERPPPSPPLLRRPCRSHAGCRSEPRAATGGCPCSGPSPPLLASRPGRRRRRRRRWR